MRAERILQAEQAINFPNTQRIETQLVKIDDMFARLVEDQIQSLMLASMKKDYIFKEVQAPHVPK